VRVTVVERRFGADRRKHARGGRRPGDREGFCPLVMVVEPSSERRQVTDMILSKLRFAVVPVESVDKALAIMRAVRPNVIVCPEPDAERLRDGLVGDIPVVAVTDDSDELVEGIRFALRARVIRIAT
jgi:hypothetical protein